MTAKAAAKQGEGGGVVPLLIDVVVDDGGRFSFIVNISFVPSLCPCHSNPILQNTQVGAPQSRPEFVPFSSTSSTKMDDIHNRIATLWCHVRKTGLKWLFFQ